MTEPADAKAVDLQGQGQQQAVQHVAVPLGLISAALAGSLRAVRAGVHRCAVKGGNHLPLAVAVHPDRSLAQPRQHLQGLRGHRPQRDITQQHHSIYGDDVGLREHCAERWRLPWTSASTATRAARRYAMPPFSTLVAGVARHQRQPSSEPSSIGGADLAPRRPARRPMAQPRTRGGPGLPQDRRQGSGVEALDDGGGDQVPVDDHLAGAVLHVDVVAGAPVDQVCRSACSPRRRRRRLPRSPRSRFAGRRPWAPPPPIRRSSRPAWWCPGRRR